MVPRLCQYGLSRPVLPGGGETATGTNWYYRCGLYGRDFMEALWIRASLWENVFYTYYSCRAHTCTLFDHTAPSQTCWSTSHSKFCNRVGIWVRVTIDACHSDSGSFRSRPGTSRTLKCSFPIQTLGIPFKEILGTQNNMF